MKQFGHLSPVIRSTFSHLACILTLSVKPILRIHYCMFRHWYVSIMCLVRQDARAPLHPFPCTTPPPPAPQPRWETTGLWREAVECG